LHWVWVWKKTEHQVPHLRAGPRLVTFSRLSLENLTQAIDRLVNDPDLKQKASELGKIQCEDGVNQAVELIKAFMANPKI
jgi:UDP:flavonoid glycosyltransferase YjiC (YdhE family)